MDDWLRTRSEVLNNIESTIARHSRVINKHTEEELRRLFQELQKDFPTFGTKISSCFTVPKIRFFSLSDIQMFVIYRRLK